MSNRPVFGAMTLFFLLYCGLLALGTYLLAGRDPPVTVRFKAVKALALNHLVQSGDLVAAGEGAGKAAVDKALAKVEGRYAQLPVRPGQMLDDGDFAPAPLLVAPPNMVAVGLTAIGTGGNAGTVYHLCKPIGDGKGETQLTFFEAGALLCGDKARTACTAIAYLKPADARTLLAVLPEAGFPVAKPTACTPARPERPKKTADAEEGGAG